MNFIRRIQKKPTQPIELNDFRFGLNTSLSPAAISPKELSICVNFKILPLGSLETREGLTRYTTSVLANPASFITYFPTEVDIGDVGIFADTDDGIWKDTDDGQWISEVPASTAADELVITKTDNKLYYLSAAKAPVLIATLQGEATIIPFGAVALILDGSYIKVWDKSTGLVILAYDDGTGVNGYQHDNTGLTADTEIKLYSGANTKAGVRFDTQDWDAGYTIAATQVDAYLKKVSSPTGNVGCELYTDAGVLVATSDTIISAADIDATAELRSFVFSSGDMSQRTIYWAVITYSGGDAANYIQLECDTVASGGDGKYYDNAPSWQDDALKLALMAIKPGRPPKARFGLIDGSRVYVAGDPSNKGLMWYCNVNDCYDWSTANGGGYVGAIDDNVQNFPIGAIVAQYGDIYIFGQASQPYICRLTGDSPSDFSLPPLFQRVYSTHKTALQIINDIWFGSKAGVNALSGVQQYGDLRTFSESDAVNDRVVDHWTDDDAFAGYNGATGQYFLKMTGYPRCLVIHTKAPVPDKRGRIRYPATEYVFIRDDLSSATYKWTLSTGYHASSTYYLELAEGGDPSVTEPYYLLFQDSNITKYEGHLGHMSDHQWGYGDIDSLGYDTVYIKDLSGDPDTTGVQIKTVLEPTAFANYSNTFKVACDDCYIYESDPTVVQDNNQDVPYTMAPKLLESPFNDVCLEKYNVSHGSDATGVTADLEIYDQKVDIDDLDSVAANVTLSIDFDTISSGIINANYDKFQAVLKNIDPNGESLRINSILLKARPLSE